MRNTHPATKVLALAAGALLSLTTLAACGDDGSAAARTPAVCQPSATDEEVAEAKKDFSGTTITFVVDRSPGGGYDQYARLVAPYLAKELDATVVVENQEGAGGLVAMNALAAKKATGEDIATFNAPGLVPAALADYQGLNFDPAALTWLGRMAGEPDLVVVPKDSPYKTFEDLIAAKDVKFGSSGPGAADYVNPSVLIDVFDIDGEVVTGYDGASEIELGLLRGDVDAMTGTLNSRIPALENGSTRALAVIAPERLEELPDVPTVFEMEPDESGKAVLEAHTKVKEIGRPIVAPPAMSPAQTIALRDAVSAVLANDDLLKEAEKIERPIGFLSGEEQCQLTQDLLEAPEEYRKVLKEAYRGGQLG